MADPSPASSHPADPAPDRHRLDSWKAIAAYVQRDVTTVRRWEKREGLPVHRHVHDKLGSVYAYPEEIDEWWQGRRGLIEEGNGPEVPETREPEVAANLAGPGSAQTRRRAWAVAAAAVVLAGVALTAFAALSARPRAVDPWQVQFSIAAPAHTSFDSIAVSPDGRQIAFARAAAEGAEQMWLRPLDSLIARPLPGTEGASFPFWSPDGQAIGFFAQRTLRRVTLSSGAVHTLADAPDGRGGAWNADGLIIFAPTADDGLFQVPAHGGRVTRLTTLEDGRARGHAWPEFLPDGRHFLYLADSTSPGDEGVYVATLSQPMADVRHLLGVRSRARYAEGHVFYVSGNALLARRFDPRQLQLGGEAVTVAESVERGERAGGPGDFSVSGRTLAYRPRRLTRSRLVWLDRTGEEVSEFDDIEPGFYGAPVLSPDGRHAAFAWFDADPQKSSAHVRLIDLANGGTFRLPGQPQTTYEPVWSHDGRRILFASEREGRSDIQEQDLDSNGSEETLVVSDIPNHPQAYSPDGRYLIYETYRSSTKFDLWALPRFGDRRAFPWLQSEFQEGQGQVSPDGTMMAYTSDESGSYEVYVQSFPRPGAKRRISTAGGGDPRWRPDGAELYFISGDHMLTAVPIETGPEVRMGPPQALFRLSVPWVWGPDTRNHYDVTRDGRRFLVSVPRDDTPPLTVVLDWQSGLRF